MKKKATYVAIAIIFFVIIREINKNSETLASINPNVSVPIAVRLVTIIMIAFFINVYSWHLLLVLHGIKTPLWKNSKIWMISNFSRLIPGTIWQYSSRIYMMQTEGISKSKSSTMLLLEGVFSITGAVLVIILTLPFWQLSNLNNYRSLLFISFLFIPFLLLVTNKKVHEALILLVKKISGKNIQLIKKLHIPFTKFAFLTMTFSLRFVSTGLAFIFLSQTMVEVSPILYPTYIGIFTFSWLIGYLAFFVPGGLGVIEASISSLLSFIIPFSTAAVLAIVYRTVMLISELGILAAIFLVDRYNILQYIKPNENDN